MFGRLYQLPSDEARRRADELLVQFGLEDAGELVALATARDISRG